MSQSRISFAFQVSSVFWLVLLSFLGIQVKIFILFSLYSIPPISEKRTERLALVFGIALATGVQITPLIHLAIIIDYRYISLCMNLIALFLLHWLEPSASLDAYLSVHSMQSVDRISGFRESSPLV